MAESEEVSRSTASLPNLMGVSPPPGLQAIYAACRRLYPDQPNPLQVTAVVKYWIGGPDPLDYISMYVNNGDKKNNVAAHWHYVTFGLSDLHGDGRVHECIVPDGPSGFGFELTFRLRREPGETAPPTWPAALLQALARYVFQSGNTLCPGDHIPWRTSLDGSESRIQHILLASDPQLESIATPFGTVNFVQVVGVCEEELKAAQQWNGSGVLSLMQSLPLSGGCYLLTDMRRGETIFEIDPQLQDQVDKGIETEGSNLSGVSGQCSWQDFTQSEFRRLCCSRSTSHDDNKENTASGNHGNHTEHCRASEQSDQKKSTKSFQHFNSSQFLPSIKAECRDDSYLEDQLSQLRRQQVPVRKGSLDSTVSTEASDLPRIQNFEAIHIALNLETGLMLQLALRGRLRHGRHFTFKSTQSEMAITLVPSTVVGSIATVENPYAAHGPWLQVLLTDDFVEEMLADVEHLSGINELTSPKDFTWKERCLSISVMPDNV